jgi:hypothetical protein
MTSIPQQLPPRLIVGATFTVIFSWGFRPVVGNLTVWPIRTLRGPLTWNFANATAAAGTATSASRAMRTGERRRRRYLYHGSRAIDTRRSAGLG